jgi:hypothetical protein
MTSFPHGWVRITAAAGYKAANPTTPGAQRLVQFAPGLHVASGTVVVVPATGPVLPGKGYFVALQDQVLGPMPTMGMSDGFLHFSKGPS